MSNKNMRNLYERVGFYVVRFWQGSNWIECASAMIDWYRERLADNNSNGYELEIECELFIDYEDILFNSDYDDNTEENYEWYSKRCEEISDAHLASL